MNWIFFSRDNPDVDVRGANSFKQHLVEIESKLNQLKQLNLVDFNISPNKPRGFQPVESILVCTGVYNPQHDLTVQINNMFKEAFLDTNNNEEAESMSSSTSSMLQRADSNASQLDLEKLELRKALSRKNSFISYFENKLNKPDLVFDNLKEAVEHIIKNNQWISVDLISLDFYFSFIRFESCLFLFLLLFKIKFYSNFKLDFLFSFSRVKKIKPYLKILFLYMQKKA